MNQLSTFLTAYIECALWSSTDLEGDPLDDNYGPEDISPEALKEMESDCEDFQQANAHLLQGIDPDQAGQDFWLTRNRHGAGFWDRGLGEVGKLLTEAAHVYGSCDLLPNDEGQLVL